METEMIEVCGQELLVSEHAVLYPQDIPLELVIALSQSRNCCPERFRHLLNITQQVCGKDRNQAQVLLIFFTPHRLLWGLVHSHLLEEG